MNYDGEPVSLKPSLADLWAWFKTGFPADADMNEASRVAFHAWNRGRLFRDLFWFLPALTAINVVFWFTDTAAFHGDPLKITVFMQGRAALILIAVAVWLVNLNLPRAVFATGTAGTAMAVFYIARCMGLIGAPSSPWFHFLHAFMFIMLISWATPLVRTGWTCLLGVATILGYFGANPDHWLDPMLEVALLYYAYILLLAFLIGLYVDDFRLRFFLRNRALEEGRALLAQRVEEKTADLRALVAQLDDLQDQERARIARDLHDDLGQLLTAQRLVLRTARRRYESSAGSIGANLAQIDGLVAQTTRRFRDLLQGLRPRVLEESGHEAGIRALVRLAEEQLGFAVSLILDAPDEALPAPIALVSYRCVQEALTNVAKHASATSVVVTLQVFEGLLTGEVRDDGVGVDAERLHAGLGLIGAKERVEAVGGRFQIASHPEGGARVQFELPIHGGAGHGDQRHPGG